MDIQRIEKIVASRRLGTLLLLILAFTSMLIVWVSTPWGVRVSHDSLFYISAAKNISQLQGLYWTGSGGELKALNHFPPLYPITVAVFSWLGMSATSAARVLGMILAGANTYLLGYVLYRNTQSVPAMIIGVSTIFFVPAVFGLHLQAMSEPLFMLCMLLALSIGAEYLRNQEMKTIVAAAVMASMAGLTRWIGTSVLLSLIIVTFFIGHGSWRSRVKTTIRVGLIGLLPILGWMLRNWSLTGSLTNRTFVVHPIDIDTIRTILDVVFSWLTTIYLSHWVQGFLLIGFFLGGYIYLTWRRVRLKDRRGSIFAAHLFLIFPPFYLLQLVISLSFFDASTRIDERMLSPFFVSMMVSAILLIYSLGNRWLKWILMTGFIGLFVLGPLPDQWKQTQAVISSIRQNGAGFTTKYWQSSALINWIQEQDDDAIIVTNRAMVVNFLTGLPAIQIPEKWDPVKDQVREDYQFEIDQISADLKLPKAYLVLFEYQDLSAFENEEWIEPLVLIHQISEGVIYSYSE